MSFELRPESMRRGARCDGGCAVVAWHLGGKPMWLLQARSLVHAAADVGEAPLPMQLLCTWLRWEQHWLPSVLLLMHVVAGGSCCGASHLFKGRRGALWHCACFYVEPRFFPLLSCLYAVSEQLLINVMFNIFKIMVLFWLFFFSAMRCTCGFLY